MAGRYAYQIVVAVLVLGLMALSAPTYAQKDFWKQIPIGDLNTLQRALEAGVDLDVRSPEGTTPLILAAMYGQTDLVRFLIENEATLNIQNNDGSTALHVAPLFGHPEAVTLLLAGGAASDIWNNDGLTPLDIVSGPWSKELEGLYEFFDTIFQMGLDIDRIKEIPPGSKRYPSNRKLTPRTRVRRASGFRGVG